ncbi:MAG: hypothetical protein AB1736_07900 [Chloroflexota bacterium]
MIRFATAVRSMPAIWLAFPLVLGSAWYSTLFRLPDGYGVNATAKGTAALGLIVPFAAATAAWEASRLRRAGWWQGPWVRRQLTVVLGLLWPSITIPLVATVVAVGVSLLRIDGGAPDARLIAVAALDIAAFSIAGFAAGLLLPFSLAGPLAIVVPLFWLTFVPAMSPVWLRHLTGMFRDCCSPSDDLAAGPLIASSILDFGIIAAAWVAIARTTALRRVIGSALSLAIPTLIGASLVAGMSYSPTIPRDTTVMLCEDMSLTRLCVWPEHREHLEALAPLAPRVFQRWSLVGIPVPDLITEARSDVRPPNAALIVLSGLPLDSDALIAALAQSLLPPFPDCPGGATGWQATEYLAAWYEWTGGISELAFASLHAHVFDPEYPSVGEVVRELEDAPPTIRDAWVARIRNITQACDPWPAHDLRVE